MRRQDHSLTPEQIEVIRWIASLGAVTAEALALRLGVSETSARMRLSSIRRRGLLARERPLAKSPALFAVTRAGLQACGIRGIKPCGITAPVAHHLIVCAAVAAALEGCYPDHRLIGERELRRDERDCGRLLASAVLGPARPNRSSIHCPDMVLWPSVPGDAPVAVEVELTIKSAGWLEDICRAWARCRSIEGVLYLAPPDVERALDRAIEKTRAQEQVVVVPLDALLSSANKPS